MIHWDLMAFFLDFLSCRDFLGDETRKEYGSNRCAWVDRDKFGFDRDQYTLEWYESTHKYEDPNEQPLTDWASF